MRVRVQIHMSVINSYHGVGLIIGNRTSIMMMTMLMLRMMLFVALQRGLEFKFKCQQSIHTTESASSSVTARAS